MAEAKKKSGWFECAMLDKEGKETGETRIYHGSTADPLVKAKMVKKGKELDEYKPTHAK